MPKRLRPSGWYTDPVGHHQMRWWDGRAWTERVADGATEGSDPQPNYEAVGLPGGEVRALHSLPTAIAGFGLGVAAATAVTGVMSALGYPGGRLFTLVIAQLALWSGLVGACLVVSRRHGTGSLRADFGFRSLSWSDVGWGLFGSLIARALATTVGGLAPHSLYDRAPDSGFVDNLGKSPVSWTVLVVILCVGAPLVEELFFRGLLQPQLIERVGTGFGIAATSVLFGAAHLIAWQGKSTFVLAIAIAGAGVGFGVLRQATGRLGPSTAAHACFNAQAVIVSILLR